jgi:hypothetical protein
MGPTCLQVGLTDQPPKPTVDVMLAFAVHVVQMKHHTCNLYFDIPYNGK